MDGTDIAVASTATKANEGTIPSSRHSLPDIGTRGIEHIAVAPSKRLRQDAAGGDGGGGERIVVATGGAQSAGGQQSGGAGEEVSKGDAGGGVGAANVAVAAATAAATTSTGIDAAATATDAPVATAAGAAEKERDTHRDAELGGPSGKQAENHLSCKYTKEEFIARQWGMNLLQMKRVKALLRMGVCEEDLEIADRLLKMGRCVGF